MANDVIYNNNIIILCLCGDIGRVHAHCSYIDLYRYIIYYNTNVNNYHDNYNENDEGKNCVRITSLGKNHVPD